MLASELDYVLPRELIAQEPLRDRDQSNLLVLHRSTGEIEHRKFFNIVEYLRKGDVMVLNTTKVLPARLVAQRKTGGKVEALFVEKISENVMGCLLDTPRRLAFGEVLYLEQGISLILKDKRDYIWIAQASEPIDLILERVGRAALPPYIKRAAGPGGDDLVRYQTVYAEVPGSIAAPTAGFHFTEELLERIQAVGADIVKLVLHVGLGTFKPIKSENIEDHVMEREYFEIASEVVEKLRRSARVIAVGTTSVRALETLAIENTPKGQSQLFIKPGFNFRLVNALVTNFHLPRTTLLALVFAFAGRELILKAYNEAIERRYRFFSYGDAMLIL
jgi:S-adenosylmethionine:tRNA ribosyltransferase-isomerase